jgi:hypothetical protein
MRKGAPRVGAIMLWLAVVLGPPLLLVAVTLALTGHSRVVAYGFAAIAVAEVLALALAWFQA